MTWVRLDDQITDHPKVVQVGPLGGWLFVCGLTYSARYLTDGFIPQVQLHRLADIPDAEAIAQRLIDVGLWERANGGYQVHDYLQYQPSSEKVKAEREAARQRMQRIRSPEVRENISGSSPSPALTQYPVPASTTPDRSTGATARECAREDDGPDGPLPPGTNGVEPPKASTIRPVPKPKPRTDAFAICLARIRDLAPNLVIGGERERNAKAVNSAHAPPELVAEAYVALMRGDWVNGFVLKQASLHAVVDNIGGYVARKAERNGTSGSAHQPQSELGQAVAREHAEHARRLASPGSDS